MEVKGFELGAAARTPAKSCEAADMAALALNQETKRERERESKKRKEKGAACRLGGPESTQPSRARNAETKGEIRPFCGEGRNIDRVCW
jgi:hypothetical protein